MDEVQVVDAEDEDTMDDGRPYKLISSIEALGRAVIPLMHDQRLTNRLC
jgi:hypothetical protein